MDVQKAIRARRSIRKYSPREISEYKLTKVLEAMRLAPSAKNLQPWRFIIINNEEIKRKLIPACRGQAFIAEAPIIVAGCALLNEAWGGMGGYMSSYPIDLAIAIDHLTLIATEEGLGTCWIGAFDEGEVKKILKVPEGVRVVALTPLGYPLSKKHTLTPRKALTEIICYNEYS
ncbi:MAG: 5,6-dimethylbenzimidazole synthase [Syntrophomonadaceae bacterium]|nr:5,6-dimethylbenzimidazole synthase [Bacillota bacterium]MBT9147413.1 5,6-dimethylbenzimidazole synthase [Bacillota bacterium]